VAKILVFVFVVLSFSAWASSVGCVAHRGHSSRFLENSRAAIDDAIALIQQDFSYLNNKHGVEFDIHHTRDGQALVLHDSTLKRTAKNKDGEVCPLESEISQWDLDELTESCLLNNGEELLTLKELLPTLVDSKVMIFLEMKDTPSDQTLKLIKDVVASNQERLRILSFDTDILDFVRLQTEGTSLEAFWQDVKRFDLETIRFSADTPYEGLNINYNFLTRSLIKKIRRDSAKEISVWTVDAPREINKFMQYQVDYITTNDLSRCLELI